MSLRDFNSPSDDPRALHNDPLGNGAGLENFHTVQPDDIEPNNTPKIVGAVAVALMVGAAAIGIYGYAGSPSHPTPVATATNLPSVPPAPAPVAAPAPDQQAADARCPVCRPTKRLRPRR